MALPFLPQPKQWKNCLVGLTLKLGDFSPWKGHRPMKLAPPFLSCTYLPTMSTTSTRDSNSWMKDWGMAIWVFSPMFGQALVLLCHHKRGNPCILGPL